MSDSLRNAHRKRILEEADKLKAALKGKLGKDCPEGFFDEVNQFVEYVYQRDSLEERMEKLTEEVRTERIMVRIAGGLVTFAISIVVFFLFTS